MSGASRHGKASTGCAQTVAMMPCCACVCLEVVVLICHVPADRLLLDLARDPPRAHEIEGGTRSMASVVSSPHAPRECGLNCDARPLPETDKCRLQPCTVITQSVAAPGSGRGVAGELGVPQGQILVLSLSQNPRRGRHSWPERWPRLRPAEAQHRIFANPMLCAPPLRRKTVASHAL